MSKRMSRDKLKMLTSIADVKLAGRYHAIYESHGARRGVSGGNFHCFNESSHTGGIDDKPSMGICNDTGVYNCFSCGTKGNLYTYWKEFISDGATDQYHDFLINDLHVDFVDPDDGTDYADAGVAQMRELYNKYSEVYEGQTGKPHLLKDSVSESIDEDNSIDMSEIDKFVDNLLNSEQAMNYLLQNRKIDESVIRKYKIGLDKGKPGIPNSRAFIFPVISPDGYLSTMKAYNPAPGARIKWRYLYRNKDIYPVPIQNFASDKVYLFEGEPDTYCAIGFGIKGAVTLGGASNVDPVKQLGESLTKRYLANKEVVICFDADKAGRDNAIKLAGNVNVYARQVKVINFDVSDINPYGLDDTLITKSASGKEKRDETDFTDYMKKNGFGDVALDRFNELVKNTKAYTDSRDRSNIEVYKVTVQESRLPKYHSEYGGTRKRLQLIASVSDIDNNAYMYYDKLPIECSYMGASGELPKKCKHCALPLNVKEFESGLINVNFHTTMPKGIKNKLSNIRITEKDILELIEVTEKQRQYKLKTLCGVNTMCSQVRFREGRPVKVIHTKLMRDISFHSDKDGVGDNDIDVDAYISGCEVENGKTYLFEGVQTTSPEGQYAAVFADKVEPVLTTIEQFDMSSDIHSELKMFKPKDGETVQEALSRRYNSFGQEARITGRHEIFFMYDLAFFSSIDFNNSLISDSVRKWVEVGIVGESRCGKSMIADYLVSKYRTGEYFSCSSAVSRSGILGGITKQFKGKNRIAWGVLPRNDGGIVAMDEIANMPINLLVDMTPSRTSGKVEIEMTLSGKANARTRKIFISNPRNWESVKGQPFEGFFAIKNVYERDEIIQRFDLLHYVKASDEDVNDFEYHYEKSNDDFTDLQARHLIMWAHSRKADEYVWEDGMEKFNKYVSEQTKRLHELFHERTLLVGQESNVRVIRTAVSLAAMMYSTPDDDYNKVFVKNEHVDTVIDYMIKLYTHKNMRFDEYSEQIRSSERLGDMRFMENIIKYVDVDSIIREQNFTNNSIQQVFFDYLYRVFDKNLYMVDAASDTRKSTGLQVFVSVNRLVQTMVSRNCLIRSKNSFEKTPMFTTWLDKMRGVDHAELSDILEYESDSAEVRDRKYASNLVEEFEKTK